MLIRSNQEIHRNILPFLRLILPNAATDPVFELTTYKRYGYPTTQGGNFVGEDESRDNFFREQLMEEEYKNKNRGGGGGHARKEQQSMHLQITSQYKKDDLNTRKPTVNMDEINDSDLDMLLDDLKEVLDEEDISDID